MAKVQTIRIRESTLRKLRFIKAYTGETYNNAIDRLTTLELDKLKEEEVIQTYKEKEET